MAVFAFEVSATTLAKTTAASLNVRDAPSGDVITSLPRGSIVAVIDIRGAWVKILYQSKHKSNDYQYGWVSANYLQVISGNKMSSGGSTVSGDDCEYEYDTNAEVCVSATDASLNCCESYDKSYYRSCEVDVDYDVSTNYEGNDY
ncbi:MAG: SH3 domain-containing protein, partial [Thiohalomonadales bacterium]